MNKNRLTLAFFTGVIALSVVSVTSSIAWYALSSRVSIGAVEISIEGERSIRLSTSANIEDAKENISYDDLIKVTNFAPVTTAHRDTWLKDKNDVPSFYDDTIYYPSDVIPSLKEVFTGFYSQDLYLFSDDDVWVTIEPNDTFIKPNLEYNRTYAKEVYDNIQTSSYPGDAELKNLTEEDIYTRLNELVKAMRFSLLILSDKEYYDYVIINPYKEEVTYLGGLLDNDIDHYFDYYHDISTNEYYERIYGDVNDRSLIVYKDNESDSEYRFPDEPSSAFNAKHKEGVKSFDYEASKELGFEFIKEDAHTLDEFTNRISTPLNIPVYKNQANKIRLSIYIEGYDLDSVNYTMGATFLAGLNFTISREM